MIMKGINNGKMTNIEMEEIKPFLQINTRNFVKEKVKIKDKKMIILELAQYLDPIVLITLLISILPTKIQLMAI